MKHEYIVTVSVISPDKINVSLYLMMKRMYDFKFIISWDPQFQI